MFFFWTVKHVYFLTYNSLIKAIASIESLTINWLNVSVFRPEIGLSEGHFGYIVFLDKTKILPLDHVLSAKRLRDIT